IPGVGCAGGSPGLPPPRHDLCGSWKTRSRSATETLTHEGLQPARPADAFSASHGRSTSQLAYGTETRDALSDPRGPRARPRLVITKPQLVITNLERVPLRDRFPLDPLPVMLDAVRRAHVDHVVLA